MNILLNGIGGHMGREVVALCEAGYRGATLVAGVDPMPTAAAVPTYTTLSDLPDMPLDCIVDFSHHTAIGAVLDFAVLRGCPIVVATTGHTEEETALIHKAAEKIPVFFSANMSLGVALLVELAKQAALAMPEADIEIIEKHHTRKLDAPSGTALMLARAIGEVREGAYANTGRHGQGKRDKAEIGIHAVRLGNIVGEHEVIVGTQSQTITLKHEAHSRALFAEGALAAADFLVGMPKGLYDMKSLVGEKKTATAAIGV